MSPFQLGEVAIKGLTWEVKLSLPHIQNPQRAIQQILCFPLVNRDLPTEPACHYPEWLLVLPLPSLPVTWVALLTTQVSSSRRVNKPFSAAASCTWLRHETSSSFKKFSSRFTK